MQFFGTVNETSLKVLVASYLKMKGIKFKFPKKPKEQKIVSYGQQLFQVPLLQQKSVRVDVSDCTNFLHIPEFLVNACNAIERDIHIEGIFRKAGSIAKQRELRRRLNSGKDLPANTHVIDTCNLVKLFFRELPEPVLPYYYHDLLLNCLLLPDSEQQAECAIVSCLLLPRENIAVLMFFLRFLLRVAEFSDKNKMDVKNLSIVLAPSLMPVKETNKGVRGFNVDHHISLIEVLISHAHEIGMVPDVLLNKSEGPLNSEKRRKRTSSLARVLTGIRRIVQPEKAIVDIVEMDTPVSRKRRSCEPALDTSAKRRKEGENSLDSGAVQKRSSLRLSRMASYSQAPLSWNNARSKITHSTTTIFQTLKTSKSLSALNTIFHESKREKENDNKVHEHEEKEGPEPVVVLASDFVTIPRAEYNAMKRRESDMDQLLRQLHGELVIPATNQENTQDDDNASTKQFQQELDWADADLVLNEQETSEKTQLEIAPTLSTTTKIVTRSSAGGSGGGGGWVMRSPSERKIGSIRRRSRELARSLSMQQQKIQQHERRDSIVSLRRNNHGNVLRTANYFDTLLQGHDTTSVSSSSSSSLTNASPGQKVSRRDSPLVRKQPILKPSLGMSVDANTIVLAKTPARRLATNSNLTPRRRATPLRAFPDAITPLVTVSSRRNRNLSNQ